MDDDAFNQLGYDENFDPGDLYEADGYDEEAELFLQERQNQSQTVPPSSNGQKPSENPLVEDDFYDDLGLLGDLGDLTGTRPDVAEPEPQRTLEELQKAAEALEKEKREKRKLEMEKLPLGEHPMDWFIRVDFDDLSAKRKKKEKVDLNFAKLADKIAHERRKKLDAIRVNVPEQRNGNNKVLKEMPDNPDGEYMRISDPEGINGGFLEMKAINLERNDWENRRIRRAITKSINNFNRPVQINSNPVNNTTQPQNQTLDVTLPSLDTTITKPFIEGIDLTKFGLTEAEMAGGDDYFDDEETQAASQHPLPSADLSTITPPTSNELWTSKYTPKSFIELLSEDAQNKIVLAWLKLWDPFIFNKKAQIGGLINEYFAKVLETEEKRPFLPKLKMLIIHGSSGCGKTTLANVCALQAGYTPFLVNLNEIQNVNQLKSVILERSANKSIDGYLKSSAKADKPICLIVEGIDNASADMIKFINTYVTTLDKKISQTRRPVIISCNNVFAPTLKPLRTAAVLVKINGLDKDRTLKFLENLCQKEGLTMKRFALVEHFDQCRGDLRLCLNNLQFYSSTAKTEEGNLNAQNSSRIEDFSIFDALDAILTTSYHLDARGHIKSPKVRTQTIMQIMSRRDDMDRLFTTVFYNAPVVFKLKIFQRSKICKFLIFDDQLSRYINRSQQYALFKFRVSSAILIHFTVASPAAKKQNYNINFMNAVEKQKENLEILNSFEALQSSELISIRRYMILDLLPNLYTIMNPPLQTNQMFTKSEKIVLAELTSLMHKYGLTYAQKFENSIMNWVLDPPIDNIITIFYRGRAQPLSISINAKKYLAQELAMKKITSSTKDTKEPEPTTPQVQTLYQRMAGEKTSASFVNHNYGSAISSITDAGFIFASGSSQAIRKNIRNGTFINVL